ncbi:MAG: aminopeptidase P family protein [Alphaproteobacteria bacterium]|nr:aminopeptidase P family protein [Alphaproteobacteria bacterium]
MALHFSREEFAARQGAARTALRERGLDALLVFSQESHYYLTGFDSVGYVFFQCAVLTADERPIVLLTRRPDLEQARITSVIEDIRIWYDKEGANPAVDLRAILAELGLRDARVGIELRTYGLMPSNWELIRKALARFCRLEDASDLIRGRRIVKSPAELVYVRRAAELVDEALDALLATTRPWGFEGDIAAAMAAPILKGGGELGTEHAVMGVGERALLNRHTAGSQRIGAKDQLTAEFSASFRRYHACLMRTVAIGEGDPRQERMFEATRDALAAMTEATRPGRTFGDVDDAHRRVYDAAGYAHARMSACGYPLGATFKPSWMDVPPMLYSGNPTPIREGMVLFLHAILADAATGLAMSGGYTITVTKTGAEILSRRALAYHICR